MAIYGVKETGAPAEIMMAPPQNEIQELHRLALLGNMRDITRFAEHIAKIDTRFRPFASHLKHLAKGFHSKAILAFVEGYLK
jgi:hypothetical protein